MKVIVFKCSRCGKTVHREIEEDDSCEIDFHLWWANEHLCPVCNRPWKGRAKNDGRMVREGGRPSAE